MIITISGSIGSYDNMSMIAERLKAAGHEVYLPQPSGIPASQELRRDKPALIREHTNKIKQSDVLLVANYDKNGVANYIGPNTFLEMGMAYALGKPIYLLRDIPELAYSDELYGLEPTVVHDDTSRITLTTNSTEEN